MLVLRHVLDQQVPGHFPPFDQRLIHAKHVGAPLRLVGTHRTGGVQHAGGNHPARAGLQAIRLREVEDAVVALVPVLEAAADVGLGGARLQAHERIVEVVFGGVQLRREVVALGLALLAGQGGVLGPLVHVMGDGAHVVEKLRVDRPAFVFLPDCLADDLRAGLFDGVFQQEPLALEDAVAQSLVWGAAVVGGLGGAGEPAFVDAAAVCAQGIPIGRGKFDPLAGVQEVPRHPGGGQPQQSAAGIQGTAQNRPNIIPLDDFRCTHGYGFPFESERFPRPQSRGDSRGVSMSLKVMGTPSFTPCGSVDK